MSPSKHIRADVEPRVLEWARETRGFTAEEAARRLRVKADVLESWERGDTKPTVKQLRRCAHAYQRAIGVFFLAVPPEELEAIKDFRSSSLIAESTELRAN